MEMKRRPANCALIVACVFFVNSASALERMFEPAFTADGIDFSQTKQFVNGKASEPNVDAVKKALNFSPPGSNWEDNKWQLSPEKGVPECTYHYLVVLKEPALVGTICANDGNMCAKGSRNGGEVFYLNSDVSGAPDINDAKQWTLVNFPPSQPMRFAVLAPGLKTRAFMYKDVRSEGASSLIYWQFYKARLFDVTPTSRGYSNTWNGDQDPDAFANGNEWASGDHGHKVSGKDHIWTMLAWEKPQPLKAFYFSTNASMYRMERYKGAEGTNPALAPDSDWEPINLVSETGNLHVFQYWAYSFHWASFEAAPTTAVRIFFDALENGGNTAWLHFAAFVDLKNAPPPVPVKKDNRPPLRIPYGKALAGEVSAAISSADGVRVRNLFAQRTLDLGTTDEAWDLKNDDGQYVTPGKYKFQAIGAPAMELDYQVTPYPNVDQLFPDRTPWLTGHGGQNGWLSDHSQNWACATRGDHVYFGAPMAEAGVCFIDCDSNGKKLWGQHDFGAWIGVEDIAADEKGVYINAHGTVYRMNPDTHEMKKLFQYDGNGRFYQYRAMAAHDGKVYLVFSQNDTSWLESATNVNTLAQENCVPKPTNDRNLLPFMLRLGGHVPGRDVDPRTTTPMGTGRLYLESTNDSRKTQYMVLAFNRAVSLGSIVFPRSNGGEEMHISILKPDAIFPPRTEAEDDWIPIPTKDLTGWNCVPVPPNTETFAVRVSFTRKDSDGSTPWFARMEGMKLLRRRFANLFPSAKVRVSSGKVEADGSWDAKREEAVGSDKPGVMLMEWEKPQKIRGLAIKEIDGARTEIDVWNGPASGAIPMEGDACEKRLNKPGWRNIATYRQQRRTATYNWNDNYFARYIDGYVDFGEEIETRAIRLRVVEQWYDNGNGECMRGDEPIEHGRHLTQSYIMGLDLRRCRIQGVAPLQYLGGETPVDAVSNKRIGVYDGESGQELKSIPCALGWHGLSFGPNGELFAIPEDHKSIARVDKDTGKLTTVVPDCSPSVMTAGPDGLIYVRPYSNDMKDPIAVYDQQGKLLRTIGKAGGIQPGPWDPQKLGDVHRMSVDKSGNIWMVEAHDEPRRILQFKTDGTFVKEILGNTHYGGGGTLNRFDKTRAYYGRVEFDIDWEKHTSKIHGILANGIESDLIAYRINGHTYLANAPLQMNPQHARGVVYIYDEKTSTVRLVAAMGDAIGYGPLQNTAVVSLLKGGVPKDYKFIWSDKNGNGQIDPDEIQFEKKTDADRFGGVGRFDEQLGCVCFGGYCSVKEFLPDGTPIYEKKPLALPANYRLSDGNYLGLARPLGKTERTENFVLRPDGSKVWSYPAHGGVSGLSITPWSPGVVGNQFAIIGHETAKEGDLGEFFVTHANTGQWLIWSADGLLAGQLMLHKGDVRSRFFGPAESSVGTRLDPLSANQEHFHGFFTKSDSDGKYYLIAGFSHMSVIEVKGIDRFQRASVEVNVTADDLKKAHEWEARQVQRRIEGRPMLIMAQKIPHLLNIDGKRDDAEWGKDSIALSNGRAKFNIGYDDDNLYVCFSVNGLGPLKNTNDDFHRCYKTGACLDLLLSTDPAADSSRMKPAAGDLRLLLTMANGKPKAVLYQPVCKNAKPGEAWKVFTQAGGETNFDRVVELSDVKMAATEGYTLEAAIPLATLGLKIKPGLRVKMDWGVLTTNDGVQVKDRMYWCNRLATGTSDDSVEAQLEPGLWGNLGF